ncbi:putative S-layer protein [Candidatus Pacearchaeota archaeon]|nr:MAG: putative S-layer protein [Candidatus Pacearchaeota archaeon]
MKVSKLAGIFIILASLAVVSASVASAEVLASWDLDGSCAASTTAPHVSASDFAFGSGVSFEGTNGCDTSFGAAASDWTSDTSRDQNDYFEVTISAPQDYNITIDRVEFNISRSATGPAKFDVAWSKDAAFSNPQDIATSQTIDPPTNETQFIANSLAISVNPGETLHLRIFGYESSSNAGTLRIMKDTFKLFGSVSFVQSPQLTIDQFDEPTSTEPGRLVIRNSGNVDLTSLTFSNSGSVDLDFSPTSISSLAVGQSAEVNVSIANFNSLRFGVYPTTITVSSAEGASATTDSFDVTRSFCRDGPQGGNLTIERVRIDNNGEGDDNSWFLLDEIEIEVRVKNNGNDDIDDVVLEMGLFDDSGSNIVSDLDFSNTDEEQIDLGNLNDGESEKDTFIFRVEPDIASGHYKLAIKAYSDDLGEGVECVDFSDDLSDRIFEDVRIETQDDEGKYIAFDNIALTPEQATCGESVQLTTEVFNIGDKDQDQVKVLLKNADLGIDESYEIRKDLNSGEGDSEVVTFTFNVPEDAEDGSYALLLTAEYDYKNGVYRERSDSATPVTLQVIGCAPAPQQASGRAAAIGASLATPEVVAGEDFTVNVRVTSLLDSEETFTLDVSGFEQWATLKSISQSSFELSPGETKEVTLIFTAKDSAVGRNTFSVHVNAGEQEESRDVIVNVAAPVGQNQTQVGQGAVPPATGFSTLALLKSNTALWAIAIVNIVLIILIIVVAVRLARR